MKKYDDVKAEKVSSGREMLPAGGYVCQILSARVESGEWGDTLVIAHDVCEGEFSGIFKRDYDSNTREDKKWRGKYVLFLPRDDGSQEDGWAKNRFNNVIGCIEDANDGYHWDWDEKKLRGKKIALVFRREEYRKTDGTTGWTVKPFKAISIGNCRDGKWGKYEDKPLSGSTPTSAPQFNEISDDSELPFL